MHDWLLIIEPWTEIWAASLWRATWQGTIALGLAWCIARSKFLSPRIVCWIWRAACLKVLATLFWAQPVSLAVLPPQPSVGAAVPTEFATPAASGVMFEEPAAERIARPSSPSEPSTSAVSVASLLVLAWLAGCCWRVTVSARQWNSLRQLRRSAVPTSSVFLRSLLHEEAKRLGIGRRPRLGTSPSADGPLLTGIWRPLVMLPARIEEMFGERELRIMLAHELAHLKRHDLAWNWLPTIVGWLFFFHPLVWLMTRSWCEAQEAACDELLIQEQVTGPADYGRLLVKLAQQLPREPRSTLAAAGVLGAYRSLERRIQRMALVKPFSFGRLFVATTLLATVALPASVPWQLVAREATRTTSGAERAQRDSLLIADGREGEEIQPAATPLPGKIYCRASLEFKSDLDAVEKYFGVIAIDPNSGAWEKIGEFGSRFQISPDGKRYLYSIDRQPADGSKPYTSDIWVTDAEDGTPGRIVEDAICPLWSPDGKEVLYFKGKDSEDTGWRGPTWLYDLATKQAKKLPVPETDEVDDWSREGNWLVTASDRHPPHGSGYQLYVMHPDGTGERRLTEGELNCYPKFSPDGKRIVYKRSADLGSLWVVDIDGSNRKQVMIENADGSDTPERADWSPDGKWLVAKVFNWQTRTTDDGKIEKFLSGGDGKDRIAILLPDGTNRRVLQLKGVLKTNWIGDLQWY
jgi:beta-lactamase regulating signal transducer with metallopeptidase domain/Tol biopolymer transport system component